MSPRWPLAAALCVLLPASNALAQDDVPVGPPVGIPPVGLPAPPPPAPPPGATTMASPALVAVGGVLVGLGVFGITGGAVAFGFIDGIEINPPSKGPTYVSLIAGGSCLLLGLPLVLIGARSVPVTNGAQRKPGPWVAASPGGVTVGVRF